MAADQSKIHRYRSLDDVNEEDGQFWCEEWDWESTVDEVGLAHEAVEPRGATCSGGGMMNRMKAARSKARGREKLSGGSLKMTCNKMELELRRVMEMRQERTKQRRRTGEFGGLAAAFQTETKGATAARRQRRESGERWGLETETRDGSR